MFVLELYGEFSRGLKIALDHMNVGHAYGMFGHPMQEGCSHHRPLLVVLGNLGVIIQKPLLEDKESFVLRESSCIREIILLEAFETIPAI